MITDEGGGVELPTWEAIDGARVSSSRAAPCSSSTAAVWIDAGGGEVELSTWGAVLLAMIDKLDLGATTKLKCWRG